ncbi:MAG: glycogen debranching protein GlgX [Acidimicrobiales bacterium]
MAGPESREAAGGADGPVWPGRAFPLGATWDGDGVNFSLFSEHATAVVLCLFDDDAETQIDVLECTAHNWHCYVLGLAPGQRYGYRVHGPYDPERGHRFNPAKLLLDPSARAIDGIIRWSGASLFPYARDAADDLVDAEDDASAMPRSVVIDDGFDWEDDRPPGVPWSETVIYEAHVKGFTKRHPDVTEDLRGTFAGLGSDTAVAHLRHLGVTAVELMPVHHIADESFLFGRERTNYWGYSSIGFFAPNALYSAAGTRGGQVCEFKRMVKALHRIGIEVILDVVYNHSAEGDHLGPVLSFRGVDNRSYYRLIPDHPRLYMDFTGTGNTLNVEHPSVLRLIMDSLRYWVTEGHVDGFRFDLASALARERYDFDPLSAFFDAIHQDPVLSEVKLIAEPWDVGPGGYQVGNFPVPWSEWNGVYRDVVRDFWRGRASAADLAARLAGSSDLYDREGRPPSASINFVTAHDGFTLADLVAHDRKHNEANLEGSRSGTDDNRSWNCGVEGPTDDPDVLALRSRQQRNLLATLFVSQGVPMLLAGDELGRSQGGNNNAWCQDNETSWLNWHLSDEDQALLAFTRRLIALRKAHPVFRRRRFLEESEDDRHLPDAGWFRADGDRMTQEEWDDPALRVLGLFLNGQAIPERGRRGERIVDRSFLLLVNGHHEDVTFTLPAQRYGRRWTLELATADPTAEAGSWSVVARGSVTCTARSLTALRRTSPA